MKDILHIIGRITLAGVAMFLIGAQERGYTDLHPAILVPILAFCAVGIIASGIKQENNK